MKSAYRRQTQAHLSQVVPSSLAAHLSQVVPRSLAAHLRTHSKFRAGPASYLPRQPHAQKGWSERGTGRSGHAQVSQLPVPVSVYPAARPAPFPALLASVPAGSLSGRVTEASPALSGPSATPCHGTRSGISQSGPARKCCWLWRSVPGLPRRPRTNLPAQRADS